MSTASLFTTEEPLIPLSSFARGAGRRCLNRSGLSKPSLSEQNRVTFNPHNILIIDFGQLGDVVMSLPALRAIRARFSHARITVIVGRPGAEIIDMSGYADTTIEVDPVELRDGFKPLSILRIFQVVKDVRRRNFDFVIDLHSFSETNLLGYFSGAPQRLFSRRPGRSLDFLANFKPKPAVDKKAVFSPPGTFVGFSRELQAETRS